MPEHQRKVTKCIDLSSREVQKVEQALQSASPGAVESAVAHAAARLEGHIQKLHRATGEPHAWRLVQLVRQAPVQIWAAVIRRRSS